MSNLPANRIMETKCVYYLKVVDKLVVDFAFAQHAITKHSIWQAAKKATQVLIPRIIHTMDDHYED